MTEEKSNDGILIEYQGYTVDLSLTDKGSLKITVEHVNSESSIDVFINESLQINW